MSPLPPPVAPASTSGTPWTTDRPVRWGFLTAARIATKWATDLALAGGAELTAVASRDVAKATSFAAQHGVGRVCTDYADLVSSDDIDIVYVASPHSHHLEHALLAIEAGKSVLVEKPTTTSSADSLRLFQAAADHGVFAMEAMWSRCSPLIREAVGLVERGALGRPVLVQAAFPTRFIAPDEHRIFNPSLAGGAILDLGVYPAHIVHALLGRPENVTATGTLTHTGVDNTSVALLSWGEDHERILGTLTTSLAGHGQQRLELIGTEATLRIDNYVKPASMMLLPHGGDGQEFVTSLPGLGYTFQAHEVHHCLRQGLTQSRLVDWQSSLDVAWLLERWLTDVGRASSSPDRQVAP